MDELTKSMANVMDVASNGVTKGVELLLKEVPDIAFQFLRFKAVIFGFTALLFIVLGIVLSLLLLKLYTFVNRYKTENKDISVALWIVFLMISAGYGFSMVKICVIAYANMVDFLYVLIAPKIYLIEFFSKLVK